MPTRCMPSSVFSWLWMLVLGSVLPVTAMAQQPDTSEQKLPEIAPREIEIRGELQLSFPSLERQPLQGFASPPTVPKVPTAHTPYVESYKQSLEDLPESLPAPETGSQSMARPRSPQRGFLEAGGGRYASRFLKGRFAFDLSDAQTLSVHADYTGTEGFSPFGGSLSGLDTPSDNINGGLRLRSRHDGVTFGGALHGRASQYALYGRPDVLQFGTQSPPERTGVGGGATAHLRTHGSIKSRVEAGFRQTSYSTDLSPSASSSDAFSEGRWTLDGRVSFPVAGRRGHLDAFFARSSYSGDVPSSSGTTLSGAAGALILKNDRLSVDAGVRVLSYSAPTDPTQLPTGTTSSTYVSPEVEVEYSLSEAVTAFAENTPSLSSGGLQGLYDDSPYAEHAPSVRPTLYTTDAGSGFRFSLGPVRLQTDVRAKYAPSYRFFVSPLVGTSLADESIQVGYGSARILQGGGQVALQGVERVEASIEAYIRDGTLVGPDVDIPYFAPAVAHAMFSVSFADQKGLIQTSGTVEGARPINSSTDREVGPYVAFDIEGSYQITSLLDAVLKLQNVSPDAPTRWARYPQPPTSIQAGLRIRW